jgi:hypothetical protein
MPKLTPTFKDNKGNGVDAFAPIVMTTQTGELAFPAMPPVPVAMQSFPKAGAASLQLHREGIPVDGEPPKMEMPFPQPAVGVTSKKVKKTKAETVEPVAPAEEPRPLKIALIGTAPTSRGLAPYEDPSWTIWACSPGNMGLVPRADAWFEVHGNLLFPENKKYGEPYIEWLKKLPMPVYMHGQQWVPNAKTFPKDALVQKYGDSFFTSSFAWMMAFAIECGADEISLYGIDMASRNEYILQRPGFFFFKWIAEQRGIKVTAPHESDIMQPPGLYGYADCTPMGRKITARRIEMQQRLNALRQERDQHIQQITYLEGAAEDLDYFESIWMGQG